MQSIFISYRREDAAPDARLLYTELIRRFGPDRVFMDVESIDGGDDYRQDIDRGIASCSVLLVVIGRSWLGAKDKANASRRLDDPNDPVRLEVRKGLSLEHVKVMPVLVGGAEMPTSGLPEDLAQLVYRNASTLSHGNWRSDFEALVAKLAKRVPLAADAAGPEPEAKLKRLTAELAQEKRSSRGRHLAIAAVAVVVAVVLGVGGYIGYDQLSPLRAAKREAEMADASARISEALARKLAADAAAAAASAQMAQAEADRTRLASEQAAAAASAAAAAVEKARQEAEKASEEEKAKAQAQAQELERQQQEADAARKLAEQKAAEVQAAAEAASAAAAKKAEDDRRAQEELARASQKAQEASARAAQAGVKAAAPAVAPGPAAGGTNAIAFSVGACRRYEARAQATITIEPQGDGASVSVQVAGNSTRGRPVSGGGRKAFERRLESYEVPVSLTWNVETPFQTTLTAVVVASGGTRFQTAYARDVRSQCPPGN